MPSVMRHVLLLSSVVALLASTADVHGQDGRKRERERAAPPAKLQPPDKRDTVVSLPGSAFNGRAYWQALAQCGGIYFKLGTLHSDVAIKARVIQPDKNADALNTKQSGDARKMAAAFFVAAERFLTTDRGVTTEEAIFTYDGRASEAGDKVKKIDDAQEAAKPCPALYQACHLANTKACSDTAPLTN
jgi:hypothetical protein